MRLVLVMVGSLGDHLPVLEIGREAARRGHQVAALGCEKFLADLPDDKIDVRLTLSTGEYEDSCRHADHDRPLAHLAWFRSIAIRDVSRAYNALRDLGSHDETVVLTSRSLLGIGARMFCEQFDIPLAEFHVDPWPMCAGWRAWDRHLLIGLLDAFINRMVGPDFNAFRRKAGLAPVRNLQKWSDRQPQLLCGLYPEWIGRARQFNDRERRYLFAGFPVIRAFAHQTLPSAVEEFLSEGPPPVLVSRPSWAGKNAAFLAETETALNKIGTRAIFTGFERETICTPTTLHFPFLPHAPLLPRVAAFIHHGGAGTCAAGLSAGTPQLVVPRVAMQHDFGVRLRHLGVGEVVSPSSYRASRVAKIVFNLINSGTVRERCLKYAEMMRHEPDGAKTACDALESLAGRAPSGELPVTAATTKQFCAVSCGELAQTLH